MDNLSIYIPMDRRQAMARGEILPDRAHGAALLADISGFTPLTEALTRVLGPQRGAEEMSARLNEVYDALIVEVDRFGGSVVAFSGDAITCWLDGDDGRRAVACGLAMQRAMRRFAQVSLSPGETVALSVKVAVAAGPVRRFRVGNPAAQYVDVVAGATLDRLAAAEHHARRDEVVVDPATAAALGDRIRVDEWRAAGDERYAVAAALAADVPEQPWPALPPGALSDSQVRPWLLPPVYERLKGGQGEFMTELRPAIALFLRFGGIDYDGDDAAGDQLDGFICRVQSILTHYQGVLLQLTMGDKGSYVYAAFGAPVAHDDDARRAVAAALDLLAIPDDMPFLGPVQMGISTGQMRVGAYGGRTRGIYGVMGDEANVAARLMQHAAAGQVVVSARVAHEAGPHYRFRALGSIQVKGKTGDLEIFELEGARAGRGAPDEVDGRPGRTPIVGRNMELAVLRELMDRVMYERRGGVAVIEGEPGIGKSRLVEALLEAAQDAGATVLLGAGDAVEQSTIYHAWRPVFTRLFGLDAVLPDVAARRAQVLARLEGWSVAGASLPSPSEGEGLGVRALAPLLASVLPIEWPDNETTALMAGRERAEATRDLLARILGRAARLAPLVLVVEDAHWLDSASWALAGRVADDLGSILLVVATRPVDEPAPPEFTALVNVPGVRRLNLGPLAADDVTAMLARRLGIRSLPEPVAAFVQEKAEGNPFFSEELAYALRDAHLLMVEDGTARLAPGAPDLRQLNFPDTVQGVITSRIDRLTPSQQVAIKVASVIGRGFGLGALREVHPMPEDIPHLRDDCETLARRDLTPLEAREPELRFLFKHVITQEVSYSLLLYAQRARLHRAVGEWYERTFAGDLARYYPVLAHHWTRAAAVPPAEPDALRKAIDYSYKAGEQAVRSNAHLEAIGHLTKALELVAALPDSPERRVQELGLQVLVAVPLTLTRGWAAPEVGAAYRRAHELCRQLGETPQLFLALVGVFTYYLVRGQFHDASEMAHVNLDVASRSGDPELILEASQDRGAAHFYMGELAASLPDLRRVAELYVPEKHHYHVFTYGRDPLAVALQHESLALWCLGYPQQSLEATDAAMAVTAEWHHPFSRAWVLASRCVTLCLRGEVDAMRATAEALIPLASEQGFPNWLAQGMIYLGWTLACAGQAEEGIAKIRDGLGLWQMTGAVLATPLFLALLADAYLKSGQVEQAFDTTQRTLELIAGTEERWIEAEAHRLEGETWLARTPAAPDRAEASFRRALDTARAHEAHSLELRAAMSLARLWQAQGRGDEARAVLEPVYAWFTEGFDTRDLVEARALLSAS